MNYHSIIICNFVLIKNKIFIFMKNLFKNISIFIFAFFILFNSINFSQEEMSDNSNIIFVKDFQSKLIAARNIEIWLPPSYSKNENQKFPVLYMHDGQNVFNPNTSYTKIDWGVDEAMTELIKKGEVNEAIVIGIWNTEKRFEEYMPQRAAEIYKENNKNYPREADEIISDNYLKFIVEELKPFIDSNYRTLTENQNTFIMGSSMGGLISAYAVCEYPEIFSAAGCVSTHWPVGEGIMIDYLKKNLPAPENHKFYFDFGTETLDAQYEPFQIKADEVMSIAGYEEGKNWITKKFPGEGHTEKAWRKRVHIPLKFLLGTKK